MRKGLKIIQDVKDEKCRYECANCGMVYYEYSACVWATLDWKMMPFKCPCGNIITEERRITQIVPLIMEGERINEE